MTVKIYHSSDSVLIRSTERDVELTRAEFDELVRDGDARNAAMRDLTVSAAPAAAPAKSPKSRHGEMWTKEEDERLLAGRHRGETVNDIAKALGRSPMAASVRLAKKYKGYSASVAAAAE